MKPYFLNLRIKSEFPYYKRVIWKIFGNKITGTEITDDGVLLVVGYTLFNLTYVDYVGPT